MLNQQIATQSCAAARRSLRRRLRRAYYFLLLNGREVAVSVKIFKRGIALQAIKIWDVGSLQRIGDAATKRIICTVEAGWKAIRGGVESIDFEKIIDDKYLLGTRPHSLSREMRNLIYEPPYNCWYQHVHSFADFKADGLTAFVYPAKGLV